MTRSTRRRWSRSSESRRRRGLPDEPQAAVTATTTEAEVIDAELVDAEPAERPAPPPRRRYAPPPVTGDAALAEQARVLALTARPA
jgi:hypothetical protein